MRTLRLLTAGLTAYFGLVGMFLSNNQLYAQNWTIEVRAPGYSEDYLLLGYYLGHAQYIKDTAWMSDNRYTFSGADTLKSGIYLVIFPPDNAYFQLMVSDDERHMSIEVDTADVGHPKKIKGSRESQEFYDYVSFLQENRLRADALRAEIDSLRDDQNREDLTAELRRIDDKVRDYQGHLIEKHPNSLTALLISSNEEMVMPDFSGSPEEVQLQTYHYVREHYFDHIPMKDPRLVRTPILQQKIDYFLNKLTYQDPDSISRSVDYILSQFDPESEAFQIYLVHFLNTYAKSNIVGMDAVYVHLAEQYYAKGLAKWTDEDLLNKIVSNAEKIKPLLIGKIAPDLQMQDRANQLIRLHEVDAPYIVLFFWDPECGHCKKAIPFIHDLYENYHSKGVEVFAVCTSLKDEVSKCWEAVDERDMGHWVNVVDPFLRSRFKQIYDIRQTPQIYVLDKDKRIVMKKIGAEKVAEILDRLMENGS